MIRDAAEGLPFPRDLLIHAARMRARGISWKTIAARTPHTAADLARLPFDHPETWEPLYERAEKLALQEAEGQMFKALNVLLEGENAHAAEKAARELLVHRRHIERRRYQPQRVQSTDFTDGTDCISCELSVESVSSVDSCPPWYTEDPPEKLRVPIIQLACCRAQGEDLLSTAAEIGYHHEEVERWPFIYAKAWDRCWRTARLETARFHAARAIRKLTDLAFDPDRQLAARAARTLLVHRRHMHWGSTNQPANHVVTVPGQGTLTYPPSLAQAVVAIPGDGSLRVARRSGPARATGAVRPSAGSGSVRSRDGP